MSDYRNLQKFISSMGCGTLIEEPLKLTGGLMHTMYGVKTESRMYAVKELNESIMNRKEALTNFINSELIAEELQKFVPAITALKKNNESIINFNGTYYMLFPWSEGVSLFNSDITENHCKKIGELLGIIHQANIKIEHMAYDLFQEEIYDWDHFILLGEAQHATWGSELIKSVKKIHYWNDISNIALKNLYAVQVLSHRDLDPKNVMWKCNNPYLIDWEAAGYINPFKELLEVINYWTTNEVGAIDENKLEAMLRSYQNYIDLSKVNWNLIINSGYSGMLGWLAYSLSRSLGMETNNEKEKELGMEQVFLTINELYRYEKNSKLLQELLESYSCK